jgi:hypothetical protein
MSVFTVHCHGTGFNRVKGKKEDELVAWFHSHHAGVEASLSATLVTRGDYVVNEGPGHGGDGIVQPQQVDPITGSAKTDASGKSVSVMGHSFKASLRQKAGFADHAAGATGGPGRLRSGLREYRLGRHRRDRTIQVLDLPRSRERQRAVSTVLGRQGPAGRALP